LLQHKNLHILNIFWFFYSWWFWCSIFLPFFSSRSCFSSWLFRMTSVFSTRLLCHNFWKWAIYRISTILLLSCKVTWNFTRIVRYIWKRFFTRNTNICLLIWW
jgi:hypothetical protein